MENFIVLEAAARKNDHRIRFVLTGSKGEKLLGKAFKQKSNHVIDFIGKTSILDLTALMSYFKYYITSDTGALHVACATDINLIALFIPRYLQRSAPYPRRPNHTVICRSSMDEIRVQDVLDALVS